MSIQKLCRTYLQLNTVKSNSESMSNFQTSTKEDVVYERSYRMNPEPEEKYVFFFPQSCNLGSRNRMLKKK